MIAQDIAQPQQGGLEIANMLQDIGKHDQIEAPFTDREICDRSRQDFNSVDFRSRHRTGRGRVHTQESRITALFQCCQHAANRAADVQDPRSAIGLHALEDLGHRPKATDIEFRFAAPAILLLVLRHIAIVLIEGRL